MVDKPSEDLCPPTEVDSARDDPERLYTKLQAALANEQDSVTQTSDAVIIPSQDILSLIPLNTEARRAFSAVAKLAKEGVLDQLHSQFVQITGKGPLNHHSEKAPTSHSEPRTKPPATIRQIIGKGSEKKFGPTRNVDILLAPPRKFAPGFKGARGLSAAHAYLHIHEHSGAWILTAGAEMKVEDETYLADEAVALSLPRTRVQILDMQYLIRFEINTSAMEESYIKERNRAFQHGGYTLPRTNISAIPFKGDIVYDSIVFRHGLGSGSFRTVYDGFNPEDGDLRVAKRIILKSAHEVPAVRREIHALETFVGCEGILELVEWRTGLAGKELSVPQYPLDVYLVHDKGVGFDRFDWNAVSEDWGLKRSLCHQLLMGLTQIHKAGCMHRDITPMNLLVFPHKQIPQATLCDFGKFCESPTDVETRLAAWKYLPPELEEGKKNPYSQKLDIWMLGLALTYW
ncbi:MAG: hypothetical protein Q9166_003657 [cf. Caloplaca sp. 2 TL-2023]